MKHAIALLLALTACAGSPVNFIEVVTPEGDAAPSQDAAPGARPDAAPDAGEAADVLEELVLVDQGAPQEATTGPEASAPHDAGAPPQDAHEEPPPSLGGNVCPLRGGSFPSTWLWADGGLLCEQAGGVSGFFIDDPDGGTGVWSCARHVPECPSGWKCWTPLSGTQISAVCP